MRCSSWVCPEVHDRTLNSFPDTTDSCLTEHAIVVSRLFADKKDSLRSVLRAQSLRLSELEEVTVVHRRGLSSGEFSVDMPFLELSLHVKRDGSSGEEKMCLTRDGLDDLLSQLQEVRELMTSIK